MIFLKRRSTLRGVTQYSRTVGDQQEVDGGGDANQVSSVGRVNIARGVDDVELASTRDVDVAAGLIGAGVEAEVDEQASGVLGSRQVASAESVGQVAVEERSIELAEDIDVVSLDLEGIDRLSGDGNNQATSGLLRRELLVFDGCGVVSDSIISHYGTRGGGEVVDDVVSHQSRTMPVAVLVSVSRRDVNRWAQGHGDGLDGPLEVRHELHAAGSSNVVHLSEVNTNEGETDTHNVNIVNLRVDEDVIALIPTSARHFLRVS